MQLSYKQEVYPLINSQSQEDAKPQVPPAPWGKPFGPHHTPRKGMAGCPDEVCVTPACPQEHPSPQLTNAQQHHPQLRGHNGATSLRPQEVHTGKLSGPRHLAPKLHC